MSNVTPSILRRTARLGVGLALAAGAAVPAAAQTGPTLVRDLRPGSESAGIPALVAAGEAVYFYADEGTAVGPALYRSDGTPAGTVRIKAFSSDATMGRNLLTFYASAAAIGSTVYFSAEDGTAANSYGLWKTDGTPGGTVLVKAGLFPQSLFAVGSTLFFKGTEAASGTELWKSDGTPDGTILLADIYPGNTSKHSAIREMTAVGSTLYFVALHPTTGEEVWKSDGTPAGTVLVKDVMPGANVNPTFGPTTAPENLRAVGTGLYYTINAGGPSLWRTDGTAEGTLEVKKITNVTNAGRPDGMTLFGGNVYFSANDGGGGSLWTTDGTAAGTRRFVNQQEAWLVGSPVMVMGSSLLLSSGWDGDPGAGELWKTDGTVAGTVLVKDIRPGTTGASLLAFLHAGTRLFFYANDGTTGYELWQSDGTGPGTVRVDDLAPGEASSFSFVGSAPTLYALAGTSLFFTATNGTTGVELYVLRNAVPVAADAAEAVSAGALRVWPSPALGVARVAVTLPSPGALDVRLYDLLGREALALAASDAPAGETTLDVPTAALAPGVYVVRALLPGGAVQTSRLVVAR